MPLTDTHSHHNLTTHILYPLCTLRDRIQISWLFYYAHSNYSYWKPKSETKAYLKHWTTSLSTKTTILGSQCWTAVLVILHLSKYAQMASRICHFIFIPLLSFDSVHSRLICRSFEPSLCPLFTSWKACICTLLHNLWECNGGIASYCTSKSSPFHTSHKVHRVSDTGGRTAQALPKETQCTGQN